MPKKREPDPDEEFSISMPVECRYENRVDRGHTYSQWKFKQQEYGYRCAYCGIHKTDTPEGYLTRDHVFPVSEGGTDHINNIVPACWDCNKLKGAELNFDRPRARRRRTK